MSAIISEELTSFLESCPQISVGTAGHSLIPDASQAVACLPSEDGVETRLFMPVATSRVAIANIHENPQIAVAMSCPLPMHRTIQLKGTVAEVSRAGASYESVVGRYMAGLSRQLQLIGYPRTLLARVVRWPCWMLQVVLSESLIEAPGAAGASGWRSVEHG